MCRKLFILKINPEWFKDLRTITLKGYHIQFWNITYTNLINYPIAMTIVHVNDKTSIVISPPFPHQVVPFVRYLSKFSNNEWSS
jgi:hypothetical protein